MLNVLQSTILPPSGLHEAWHVRLAATLAFTTAVSSNFIWNRYWTYPDSRSRSIPLQVVQFFTVNIVAVGMRLILVSLLYRPLGSFAQDMLGNEAWDAEKVNQIGTNISQMMSMGIALFWNFFINRYWTYNDVE
jgi:putative flippase GtrA